MEPKPDGDADVVEPLLAQSFDCDQMDTDQRRSRHPIIPEYKMLGCLDKYFKISERGSSIGTEIGAGCACFLSASVAIPVIPLVMNKGGIPLVDAITSLCLCCSLSCFIVGFMANLPFILVPSLGMAIFFTYGMMMVPNNGERYKELGSDGFGGESFLFFSEPGDGRSAMSLENALACVFIAGAAMLLLTVTHLVDLGMRLVPNFIKVATIAGIGMLVTFIGLESSGLIVNGQLANILTLSVPAPTLRSPAPETPGVLSNPRLVSSAASILASSPLHLTEAPAPLPPWASNLPSRRCPAPSFPLPRGIERMCVRLRVCLGARARHVRM